MMEDVIEKTATELMILPEFPARDDLCARLNMIASLSFAFIEANILSESQSGKLNTGEEAVLRLWLACDWEKWFSNLEGPPSHQQNQYIGKLLVYDGSDLLEATSEKSLVSCNVLQVSFLTCLSLIRCFPFRLVWRKKNRCTQFLFLSI